ncbi:BAG domain-containing protein Samui-like [Bradysia coprophila]|uniref:BAG domain-containing protein Samui-like n=1 Tax=Bradysia coprophila TaxID=38358 RepID=UPI00187DCBAC|nr:BAG domain-containing protein Samui-like [Bradysia coprophila]
MSDVSKQNNCNGGPDQVANNQNSKENQSGQSNSQSNVRYIPITLDYDDKTVNTDNNKSTEQPTANPTNTSKPSSARYQHSNHFTNDPPKPSSIFDRVKHFPVNLRSTQRNESPGRTIPITVQSECGKSAAPSAPSPKPATPQPAATSPKPSQLHDEVDSAPPTDDKFNADANAILKIQIIQKEIQCLMDQVDSFGGTRKDKDYMYLDEMLTQNLLKLDTIDTDGKEKIKQARREAIKCIHTCISVLEAKAEAAVGNVSTQQQSNDKSQAKSQN